MAPVFVKFSNELNRIKLLLNNQLDSDYRKSVWSPFVCGECRICPSSNGSEEYEEKHIMAHDGVDRMDRV